MPTPPDLPPAAPEPVPAVPDAAPAPPPASSFIPARALYALTALRAAGETLRFRILRELLDGPPAGASELTRPLRERRTTISKALHRLVRDELLVRADGVTRDGRASRFMIDPA